MVLVKIYTSLELQEHPVLNSIPYVVWEDVFRYQISSGELLLVEKDIDDSLNAIAQSSSKKLQLKRLLLGSVNKFFNASK